MLHKGTPQPSDVKRGTFWSREATVSAQHRLARTPPGAAYVQVGGRKGLSRRLSRG